MNLPKPLSGLSFRVFTRFLFSLLLAITLNLSFTVPTIFAQETEPAVLGTSTISDSQKTLLFAKPAVVQVVNIVTGDIILQASLANEVGAPSLTGRSYSFTIGGSGSGFFVSPDGYLITNGHVANPDMETISYYAIAQATETIYKDALKIVVQDYYGYIPTDDEIETVYQQELASTYQGNYYNLVDEFVYGYKVGEMEIDNVTISNYIQTGVAQGSAKIVKDTGKTANLIDSLYTGEFSSKDLALLKVEGSNFPIIELGSFENINIGTEVYALGYPGIVEELMGVLTDTESELEPSITKGIVSAKKKLVDGTETFQTDAAITHGNSGGAAIDINGKLIGVTTWGFGDLAGGESFNFLISVEKVKELLNQNNVSTGNSLTNDAWEKGLNLYAEKHYSAAIKEFETAKRLYSDNIDVDKYITQAQTAVKNGEDIPLLFGFNQTYVLLAGGGGLILIVLIVVVIFIVSRKKKTVTPPAQPVTQTPIVPPTK